ncbi:MAG TPA: transporter associated domain-containing protein, partial [Thermoanaerobaculia bacterium]|nr:transporter associated domain-containing protein [Thermoanaerobaculia bacterium]
AEETVGGYVAARLGREVAPGDHTTLGDLQIDVVDAERFRVRWVIVQAPTPQVEEEAEEPSA